MALSRCFSCGYIADEMVFVYGRYGPDEKKFFENCPNCGTEIPKKEFDIETLPPGITIEAINRAAELQQRKLDREERSYEGHKDL